MPDYKVGLLSQQKLLMKEVMIMDDFLNILKELLSVPSPSGREEKVAEIVRKHLDSIGYSHETDPCGNVLVRIQGKNPEASTTILAAHMDEIAVVVTAIEGNGDLKVAPSGGFVPCKLGERQMEIVSDKPENITGLFSMGSAHTKAAREGSWAPGWDDVRIKTGLSPEQLKAKGIRNGSQAVPVKEERGPYIFGDKDDPMISAWTFDDRAGVAELLIVLKSMKEHNIQPAKPLIIAFTVHEEGGCHGAKVLAHREKPEIFIAIDGCPVIDSNVQKLDGTPACWSKDSLCNYDQRLIIDLMKAAKEAGTELQTMVYTSAASDASAVYNTGGAPRIGFIGHVRTNSHGFELAKLSVFPNTIKTIVEYVKEFV
jgi:putative aminopeptidase FrvX